MSDSPTKAAVVVSTRGLWRALAILAVLVIAMGVTGYVGYQEYQTQSREFKSMGEDAKGKLEEVTVVLSDIVSIAEAGEQATKEVLEEGERQREQTKRNYDEAIRKIRSYSPTLDSLIDAKNRKLTGRYDFDHH